MKTFRNAGTFRASTAQLLPVAGLGEPFGVLDGQAMQAAAPVVDQRALRKAALSLE